MHSLELVDKDTPKNRRYLESYQTQVAPLRQVLDFGPVTAGFA
jgi:hypothetical protein